MISFLVNGQPGMIMATVDFLNGHPRPGDADINANISKLCRRGTYVRGQRRAHPPPADRGPTTQGDICVKNRVSKEGFGTLQENMARLVLTSSGAPAGRP